MSNPKNIATPLALNLAVPFILSQLPNGGWTVKQSNASSFPSPAVPGQSPSDPNVLVGAYSSADDLLAALSLAMNPPEPEKILKTEVPPFDLTNAANEWLPMSYAPRTGVYVRIEDEEGARHLPMKFTAPYWWDAPNGELRLADTGADYGITRAVKWRPLSPEDDARYNSVRHATPVARAPVPSAFR